MRTRLRDGLATLHASLGRLDGHIQIAQRRDPGDGAPVSIALGELARHDFDLMGDMASLTVSAVSGASEATTQYVNGNLDMAAEAREDAGVVPGPEPPAYGPNVPVQDRVGGLRRRGPGDQGQVDHAQERLLPTSGGQVPLAGSSRLQAGEDVKGDRQGTGESTANGYDHRVFDLSEKAS
ncbi:MULTISPECIES: DUF6507 family protein [unclassified Nocardiopsis]|uniref:DUF6507 family protein n=1 Tax=unclassified Nocardiopsis TaxID=2649073 RepID=UPI0026957AA4